MWDLPGSEIEPVSLALAGQFVTTEPPGKPLDNDFFFKERKLMIAISNTCAPTFQ